MTTGASVTGADILNEKHLLTQIILEDYLSVALNLRRCSLMTIPAELPDADMISRRIDERCVSDLAQLTQERDVKKRLKAVRSIKEKLRRTYLEEIKMSAAYTSHIAWIKRLGLQMLEVEVRPTVREHFIFKQEETRDQIENLTRKRLAFREAFLKHVDENTPRSLAAYPEERFPEYLTGIGELLGYPQCCIKAYIEGREEKRPSAEQRAVTQMADLRSEGSEPDIYAYFSKDFIPCAPNCSNASAVGKKVHEMLSLVDDKLPGVYLQCLKDNVERVGSYVENIQAHKAKIEIRSRELGIRQ